MTWIPQSLTQKFMLHSNKPVQGFTLSPAGVGSVYSVTILGACEAKASGVIVKGDKLISATDRRVKKALVASKAASKNVFGVAQNSVADGDFVRYLKN